MEGSRQRYANQNHSVALRGPEKAFVEGVAGVRSVLGEAKHSETNNTNPTTTANTALRPKGTLRVASHTRLHTMGTHNATPAVLLTREEVRICREAFDASARNPVLQQIFRTHSAKAMEEVPAVSSLTNPISKRRVQQQQQQHQQRPTNQKSASSSTAIPPPEATAALQMMGLSLPQGITSATLRRQQNVDFDAFIDIVTRIKQTFKGDPTRDGDVVEAFVGMGGDAGDLSKGISAKALQIAVHELGLEFDETEKVDAEGDVADVDEAEYALNAVAQGGTLYDHHRLLPFRGFKSLLSTFRAGVYCVIAAMRLRRSRMPWFLDSVRIASFPSSQRHVARTKADFKPADSWEGRRHGYYFARGVLGIGYYRILGELPQFHSAAQAAKECGFAPPLRTHPILAESSEEEDEATPATTKLRNKIAKGKDLLQSVLEGEWKLVKSTREQKQNIDSIFERIHRTMDEDDPYVASEGSSSMSPTSAALSDNPFGNSVFETRVQLTPGIRRRNLRAPPKPELTLSPLSPLSPRSPGFVTSPRKSKVPKGTPKVKSPIKPSSPAKLREVGVESSVFSAAQREHAEGPVGNDFVQTLLSVLRLTAEQRKDIEQVMPEAAPETATSSDPHHLGKNPFSETSDAIEEIADVLNDLRSPLPQRHTLHRKNEDPQPRRAPKLRKVEAPLQEKYGFKHTAVLLREAVFCAMANAKADRLTALWKRDYTRDVTDPSVEARNRVLDYSWQRWCAREEDENRNPSDGISRTYSQRLGELDDQYDSGSDEDYVGDPENGRRLARYAQEMGLRSTTGDVDDAEIEDILERISDLSDMAEDRVVLFEEFAAFFDKYRVYKAHTNVGTFSLRKPNSKETKLTSRIPLLTDAPEVQPTAPLQITDTPNESVSPTDNSSTVLITSGGAFIKPCANITYKNTPRSEDGVLKKGGSRFLPIDWDTIETRLQESKEHRLLLDTPETIAMKQSLGSYMLKAGNHEGEIPQNHSDEEVEDEEEAVPDVAEVVAAQRWEEKLLQEEAAEARRVYVIEELSRRQEEQQNRKDDFTRLAVQKFRKCNQTEGAEEATPSTSSSSEDEECEEGLPQEFAAATQFSRHMVANRHDPALVAQESRQEKQMTRMLMMEAAKQTNAMRHPEIPQKFKLSSAVREELTELRSDIIAHKEDSCALPSTVDPWWHSNISTAALEETLPTGNTTPLEVVEDSEQDVAPETPGVRSVVQGAAEFAETPLCRPPGAGCAATVALQRRRQLAQRREAARNASLAKRCVKGTSATRRHEAILRRRLSRVNSSAASFAECIDDCGEAPQEDDNGKMLMEGGGVEGKVVVKGEGALKKITVAKPKVSQKRWKQARLPPVPITAHVTPYDRCVSSFAALPPAVHPAMEGGGGGGGGGAVRYSVRPPPPRSHITSMQSYRRKMNVFHSMIS